MQEFSFANIDKFSTGSLVTRLTNDITQIQNFVNTLLRMCLRSPGILIGALIMSISLRPSLSVVFAVTIPIMLVTILAIVKTCISCVLRACRSKVDNHSTRPSRNAFTNVRVVKSFVREDY